MVSEHSRIPMRKTSKRSIRRWVCECKEPPVLLATYDGVGTVSIKARDRYWTVEGRVWARCPLCGTEHYFDPASIDVEQLGA